MRSKPSGRASFLPVLVVVRLRARVKYSLIWIEITWPLLKCAYVPKKTPNSLSTRPPPPPPPSSALRLRASCVGCTVGVGGGLSIQSHTHTSNPKSNQAIGKKGKDGCDPPRQRLLWLARWLPGRKRLGPQQQRQERKDCGEQDGGSGARARRHRGVCVLACRPSLESIESIDPRRPAPVMLILGDDDDGSTLRSCACECVFEPLYGSLCCACWGLVVCGVSDPAKRGSSIYRQKQRRVRRESLRGKKGAFALEDSPPFHKLEARWTH
jgi:hypothetical protein